MTISVVINGKKISIEPGYTVIQACEIAGVEVPRFCYHDRLKIAGNCRMCLVEIEGGPPKPVASCAMPVADGMVVHTNTSMVRKARQGVMEFLLINHPLDCPICDQGGECDLQDQAMLYGHGFSRFKEYKRAVPYKNFGPLIKTEMNRCIHCTRCIRFLSDIAGSPEIGAIGRGEDMEISTYIKKSISSEMSGNIIDLCPVGALTSKPYAFTARSWELTKVETIDVLDAVGSNIRVDVYGRSVMRVLPRLNDQINEEWISDKARFAYDGLKVQRLDRPYLKDKNGKFKECTWKSAFAEIAKRLELVTKSQIAAVAGDLIDVESVFLLKKLMRKLDVENLECRQDGALFNTASRGLYTFNTTISGIEDSDFCLLINTNPKLEAPIINARLRKRFLCGDYKIANIGTSFDSSFAMEDLGDNADVILKILEEKHHIVKSIQSAKRPVMIMGQDIFKRKDADYLLHLLCRIAEKFGFVTAKWNRFNVLHKFSGRVGALDVGFSSQSGIDGVLNQAKFVYLLAADECVDKIPDNAFVVYQGHHGDKGVKRADVILPGAAYTEKDAIYINTEGRAQNAYRATFPPGDAKEDWLIIKNLAQALNIDLKVSHLDDIRELLAKIGPQFKKVGTAVKNSWALPNFTGEQKLTSDKIQTKDNNFYITDVITRASVTMAKCSEEFYAKRNSQ